MAKKIYEEERLKKVLENKDRRKQDQAKALQEMV